MNTNNYSQEIAKVSPLLTMAQFAAVLGIAVYKVRREVKAGRIPTFRVGNGRKLIRLDEGLAAIERTRQGGAL
jgi:excisionase family DNA binding protein